MNHRYPLLVAALVLFLILMLSATGPSWACSSFMLHKGEILVFGHNLNEGDIGVPGMLFINKRGVFKTGRTWSELINKDGANPSSLDWISRYGSVTVNCFGRDFPDGGINEAGLFIWEMNEEPKSDSRAAASCFVSRGISMPASFRSSSDCGTSPTAASRAARAFDQSPYFGLSTLTTRAPLSASLMSPPNGLP